MRIVIILAAAVAVAGAQQTAKEVTVPKSPAEVTLEKTAQDIREKRQAVSDSLQQSRFELDKENKALIAQIENLQQRMEKNRLRVQQRFNDFAKQKQRGALIDQAQIPWLSAEVRKSANLPDNAQFDVETGKWWVPK